MCSTSPLNRMKHFTSEGMFSLSEIHTFKTMKLSSRCYRTSGKYLNALSRISFESFICHPYSC